MNRFFNNLFGTKTRTIRKRKPARVRLGLDTLESRTLLAGSLMASLSVVDSVLRVEGTDGADQIQIYHENGSIRVGGINITVTGNGPPQTVPSVARTNVVRIEVAALGGDDLVRMQDTLMAGEAAVPMVIDGGSGNDTITGGWGSDTIIGGLGDDSLTGMGGDDTVYGGEHIQPVTWYQAEGNAADATGGNDGVTFGTVGFAPGRIGQAFQFSGPASPGYVQVLNAPELEPSTVSVEAWVNSAEPNPNGYIVSKGADEFRGASYALYSGPNGGLRFYIGDGSGYIHSPDAGPAVWDGNWHHVVGTFDGTYTRLYVDGAEVGNGTYQPWQIGYGMPTTNDLFVGTYPVHPGYTFNGLIDEPSVYNRALSAANVQALFTGGKPALIVNDSDTGSDTLSGGSGSDTLYGGEGGDLLVGQNGADSLLGQGGNDILLGAFDGSAAETGGDSDSIYGGDGADRLWGGDGGDLLVGENGADLLAGQNGNDILLGAFEGSAAETGGSRDSLYGGDGGDRLWGGDGGDLLVGENGADLLAGQNGNDILLGAFEGSAAETGGDGDSIYGGDGGDRLWGGDGHDELNGEDGDDLLAGQGGRDTLFGHDGSDSLYGGIGNDRLVGGDDNDDLYGEDDNDILVGAHWGNPSETGNPNDALAGGRGSDQLYGGIGNDRLIGGDDDDDLYGEDGNDIMVGSNWNYVTHGADAAEASTNGSGNVNDALAGGRGSDSLYGGIGNDRLIGGDDDDDLYGEDGNDIMVGSNWNYATHRPDAAEASTNGSGNVNDALAGGRGSDSLYGGIGNDRLIGGDDNDDLYGDTGNDIMVGSNWNYATHRPDPAEASTNGSGNINDTLFGDDGRDSLYGGTGNDLLDGGWAGPTPESADNQDLLEGEQGNDVLWGGEGGDTLVGGRGFDTLHGENGSDTLLGGHGKDELYGEGSPDYLAGGEHNDTLDGGAGRDTMDGGDHDDELRADRGDEQLFNGEKVLIWVPMGDSAKGTNFCGPSAASRLLRSYQHWDATYPELIDRINDFQFENPVEDFYALISKLELGTIPSHMVSVLRQWRPGTQMASLSNLGTVLQLLGAGRPVIALVNSAGTLGANGRINDDGYTTFAGVVPKTLHYVVLTGFDMREGNISYMDFDGVAKTYSFTEFNARWDYRTKGPIGAALTGPLGCKERTIIW